jgi:hypothetical protein
MSDTASNNNIVSTYAVPKDHHNSIYWVCLIYGLAVLAPFNAVLSTQDFFAAKMPGYPIEFVLSFAINGVIFLVVIIAIAYPEKGSHGWKINTMFGLTSLILVLIPFVTILTSHFYGAAVCFWATCALLVILGVVTAISQAAFFGYIS